MLLILDQAQLLRERTLADPPARHVRILRRPLATLGHKHNANTAALAADNNCAASCRRALTIIRTTFHLFFS